MTSKEVDLVFERLNENPKLLRELNSALSKVYDLSGKEMTLNDKAEFLEGLAACMRRGKWGIAPVTVPR